MSHARPALLCLALSFAVIGHPARAAESLDGCTGLISSLPATINTPGTWCITKNLTTSAATGNAITINANSVTLDCNRFTLNGTAGTATQSIGIYAFGRSNNTVRNCRINGFFYGIKMFGSAGGGNTVEESTFDANTHIGIHLQGDGSVVQRNRVLDTGGSTVAVHAYAISTGYAVDILDNSVSGVFPRAGGNGYGTGINSDVSTGGTISDNRVRGVAKDGTGLARGIFIASSNRLVLTRNHVTNAPASANSRGITCGDAYSRAKDNVIVGFASSLLTCVDDGNVLAP